MRKNAIAIILIATMLALCACELSEDPSDDLHESEQSSPQISEEVSNQSSEYQAPMYQKYRINDLGIPLAQRYSQDDRAITPWDMIVYKNDLYIGSGDFSSNAGPIDMWKYNRKDKNWVNSGTLPDEEISRFFVINGTLVASGIDPQESWDYGNIYFTNGTKWSKKRTIPNASHCFDLAVCEDKLFAAIEYEKDQSSLYAAVSENDGQEFKILPLLKDDNPVPRNNFLTDIFTLKDKAFVTVSNVESGYPDVYVYDGESFKYYCTWNERIKSKARQSFFYQKAVFNDDLYLATGYLYKCESIDGFIQLNMPNNEIAQDLYIHEDELFVLGMRKKGSDYVIAVYKITATDDEFEKILEFEYETRAVSFAMSGNSFYFGLAPSNKKTNNGRILEIEIID